MLPDSLALMSMTAVKAALAAQAPNPAPLDSATPASTSSAEPPNTPPNTETLTAKVINIDSQPPGYLFTLALGQERLQVTSNLALPLGTQLLLEFSPSSEPQTRPELTVIEILLPAGKQLNQPELLQTKTTLSFIETVLKPFINSRLPLLSTTPLASAPPTYSRTNTATPNANNYAMPQSTQSPASSPLHSLLQALAEIPAPPATQIASTLTRALMPTPSTTPLTSTPASAPIPAAAPTQPIISVTTTQPNTVPTEVLQILKNWQQQLPTLEQLSHPPQLKHSILNSGLSYEHHANTLLQTLNQSTPTAGVFFKQLLARYFPANASIPAASGLASNQQNNSSAAQSLSQLLQVVKDKLEGKVSLAAPNTTPTTPTAPSLLQALLNVDTKAALSRALLLWTQQIAPNSSQKIASPNTLPLHLPPSPMQPELMRLVQSALAQIEHEQAQHLQSSSTQQSWQLAIPLFYQDQQHTRELRFLLEKKEDDRTKKEVKKTTSRWRLRLYFDLTQLGPLDIDLELQLPKLKATFWSRQPDTLTQLNLELLPLRNQLTRMGVEIEDLQVRHGQLPEPSRNQISQRLIDLHS